MTQHPEPTDPNDQPGKMGFTMPRELEVRARRAYRAQYADDHAALSYSEYLVSKVLEHVDQLEATYNRGRHWPPVSASQMPRGPGGVKGEVVKKTVTTRPTREQADRIRGTAVGRRIKLGRLITDAIEAAVGAAPPDAAGPVDHGRPIDFRRPTDSGPSFP